MKQGPLCLYRRYLCKVQESHRSDFGASRKAPKTKGRALKSPRQSLAAEPQGLPNWGARPWGSAMAEAPCPRGRGGRLADPQGQGTPCRVPSQPLSTIPLDVLPYLDGQTTSEPNKTRTVV